jgi:hypothetical protein
MLIMAIQTHARWPLATGGPGPERGIQNVVDPRWPPERGQLGAGSLTTEEQTSVSRLHYLKERTPLRWARRVGANRLWRYP